MEQLNFDDEARKLFKSLQSELTDKLGSKYNNLDPIYKSPINGAVVYVGNQTASQSRDTLDSRNITNVVNTTDNIPCFFEDKGINYLRFPISFWSRHMDNSDESTMQFLRRLFTFVDDSLRRGENVLVHCLAGAHRAGTTGVLLLMRYTLINDVPKAIQLAKSLRPIIDPIGMLPELLRRYAKARNNGLDDHCDINCEKEIIREKKPKLP